MHKRTWKFIFSYVKKNVLLLLLSLVFALVSVAGSLYMPILSGDAIDYIIDKNNVAIEAVIQLIELGVVVIVVTVVAQWLMNLCNNKMTASIVCRIRKDAMRKLEVLPIRYLDRHAYGELVSRMISDVETFSDGLLMGFSQLFTGIITIVGTLVLMLLIDVKIALVVILITPLSFFVAAFISKRTFSLFSNQSKTRGEQTAFIEEMIGNQKTVRAFAREEEVSERFRDINGRLQKTSLKAIFYSSLTNPSTRFVNALVYAGVGIAGAFSVIGQAAITVGQLSCFLSYANQYTKPFNEISGVITEFQNALACAERIQELIEEPAEEAAVSLIDEEEEGTESKGEVILQAVSFQYVEGQKLIENLNLAVRPGQRIAIVGPTGCGKTTLINLLMRFYDGEIQIDGTAIEDMSRHELRSAFGMVLQETWIRQGTIRENIAIGKEGATIEEITEAAKKAHAHGFIKRLPNGYDTQIMEDGGNLSNGQKQLLCISRVMLANPSILILDEATSSIDTRTEMKIQDAFEKLMIGKTSFIVAHRLSTIQSADLILVMKDGNVIEQGNHEELLQRKGFYYTLYQSQWK